jgi:hypothetical protein
MDLPGLRTPPEKVGFLFVPYWQLPNLHLWQMREQIIKIAEGQIGIVESPPNSNKTKYGKWFGLDGVPWCGIFVSWVYDQAKRPLGNVGFKKGFAGCPYAVAHYAKIKAVTTDPKPGDIVFFDWNKDGRSDHTGLFEKWIDQSKGEFETIEGNTSLTNQSNGGQVMRRKRNKTSVLFFVDVLTHSIA